MKVQIEGKIYLESDERQFVLKEYYTIKEGKNAGEEASNVLGYFSDINHAMLRFLRMKVKETTATNLVQLVEDIRRIEIYIRDKFEITLGQGRKAV